MIDVENDDPPTDPECVPNFRHIQDHFIYSS